jgi:hypothetical protein
MLHILVLSVTNKSQRLQRGLSYLWRYFLPMHQCAFWCIEFLERWKCEQSLYFSFFKRKNKTPYVCMVRSQTLDEVDRAGWWEDAAAQPCFGRSKNYCPIGTRKVKFLPLLKQTVIVSWFAKIPSFAKTNSLVSAAHVTRMVLQSYSSFTT